MKRYAIIALLILGTKAVPAQEKTRDEGRVVTVKAPGASIEIEIRKRAQVDPSLFVDAAGLRLYVADAPTRTAIRKRLSEPKQASTFFRSTLSKKRAETGVEPDTIPVRGEQGKKLGTEGMVLIKGGEYVRPGEYFISNYVRKPYAVKGQRYRIRVSSFYIDKYKVTNEEYCRFLNDGNAGYRTPWDPRIIKDFSGRFITADPNLSDIHVVSVNWYQAQGYARWAGKRLPTEAAWEFAAGGEEGRRYPWGNQEPDETRANYFGRLKHHTPGDRFPAGQTPEGVCDLVGNSAEWIADFYDEQYYRTAPEGGLRIDPRGPGKGTAQNKYRRMFKGLCKGYTAPEGLRVLKRHSRPPLLSSPVGIGFRCVLPGPSRSNYLRRAQTFVKHAANPVLDIGPAGAWDEGRCGCFTVSKVESKHYLWYMGSGDKKPWRIGLATSDDGIRWTRSTSNPVLGPGKPGRWDDRQVSMPYVLEDSGTFRMWYSGAGKGGGFGLATSPDGVNWERQGTRPVLRGTGGSMDPCVRKFGDTFVMWYIGKVQGAYRIMRAASPDGITWVKDPSPVLPLGKEGEFDQRHHAGPCVLKAGDTYFMWYLGSDGKKWRVGLSTSSDGLKWARSSSKPVLDVGGQDAWDGGSILGHDVLLIGNRFHIWYAAVTEEDSIKPEHEMAIRIGYATSAIEKTSAGPVAHPPMARSPLNPDEARTIQMDWAKHLSRDVVETNSIGMKMMLVPPGEFTMGLTEKRFDETMAVIRNDPAMKKNTKGTLVWSMLMMPAHRVRITKPFYMGTTEVTVEQFRRFAEASGYKTEAERGLNYGRPYKGRRAMSTWRKPMAWRKNFVQKDDEPVLQLCWNDCVAFCEWLSKQEGVEYGLPTEAEWEYACRAGTTTPWSFGDRADFDRVSDQYAWWSDGSQGKHQGPRSVGRGKPNAFGLYDMHGNVWEYVADWWHRLSYKEAPLNDPTGPAVQSEKGDLRRIIRGSSYDWGRWGGESSYRMRITQRSNQHPHMGFRVVRRIKSAKGVPPAVDPDEERRRLKRDPGVESEEVTAALKAGTGRQLAPEQVTIDLGDGVGMEFVRIPAGSFLMGSGKGESDERPVHRVVISKSFYMARHEVTQEQWEAVMGEHPRLAAWRKKPNNLTGPRIPMNGLSWFDCQRFIRELSDKAPGQVFGLPTEAQWEYAARAGGTGEYSFGNDVSQLVEHAWVSANKRWPAEDGSFHYYQAATKKPNAFGLYDMHGGVWEWCADRYDADYYLRSPLKDPAGPESGRFRVLRGGSWFRYAKYARNAYRRFFHPRCDGDGLPGVILDFGFRPIITLKE